jgi:2-phosphoglycerate kinase
VLLLGGASGVGKTVLAHKLARHYGVSLLLVDDVRLAIQQVTTPEQHPALH